MNKVSQYLQIRGISLSGIASCFAGLVGLCFLAIFAPYIIGYTAEVVPVMQPILVAAGFLVALSLSLSLAERILISFGEPPFLATERQRKWGFGIVTSIATVVFAAVIDIPFIFDFGHYFTDVFLANASGIDYAGPPIDGGKFLFFLVQPLYLLAVFFILRRCQISRSWFLLMMLGAVFAGYLIQVFMVEFFAGALLLIAGILVIPFIPFIFAAALHDQTRRV